MLCCAFDQVLDMSTVLDAMRSESTRANRQLMGEACFMLRGMMTGVLLGPDHALNSLTTAERRKVVATHDGLDAVMQCIIDATGDADDTFLLQAFECLCELGGAEACRAQMAEEGTASLVLSLMSGHLSNPRVAELGCHLCMQLLHQRPEVQESVASLPYDGGLAVVLYAMKAFPADGGVQCCGVGALAASADNASNATLIVAQGGLPLICASMRSFPFPVRRQDETETHRSRLNRANEPCLARCAIVDCAPARAAPSGRLVCFWCARFWLERQLRQVFCFACVRNGTGRCTAAMARLPGAVPHRECFARRLHPTGCQGRGARAGDGGDAGLPRAPAAADGRHLVPRCVCSSAAAARDADAGARDLALLRCDPVSPFFPCPFFRQCRPRLDLSRRIVVLIAEMAPPYERSAAGFSLLLR